jgi:hypothetical protein
MIATVLKFNDETKNQIDSIRGQILPFCSGISGIIKQHYELEAKGKI